MLRSAAQRAVLALKQPGQRSVLFSAFQEATSTPWLATCGSQSSARVQVGFPALAVQHLHCLGFAFAEPAKSAEDETQEKRGEKGQPTAERFDDVEVGKHSNTDGPEKYDQGHIEATPTQGMGHHDRKSYMMSSPTYTKEYVESVTPRHKKPEQFFQTTGLYAVTVLRWSFDTLTRYGPQMTESKWMIRVLFLETIAGVPGMVGAMLRHLRSLRSFKRDHGWIHTLLEEAENERMHLLTFLALKQPNFFFRAAVLGAQGVFFNLYTLFYMLSPRHCHAFVGYLEEEAVKTYTHCLHDIDTGKLDEWKYKPAPEIAREYWNLEDNATMRDVILAIRADEACHSHVNHTFSQLKALEDNPFSGDNSHTIP